MGPAAPFLPPPYPLARCAGSYWATQAASPIPRNRRLICVAGKPNSQASGATGPSARIGCKAVGAPSLRKGWRLLPSGRCWNVGRVSGPCRLPGPARLCSAPTTALRTSQWRWCPWRRPAAPGMRPASQGRPGCHRWTRLVLSDLAALVAWRMAGAAGSAPGQVGPAPSSRVRWSATCW